MGYSLSVQARNPKLHARMVEFMGANFRPWWQVTGSDYKAAYMGFRDEVSYRARKNTVGFDYNAAGFERIYAFAATRWMALKIGKRRSKFKTDWSKTETVEFKGPTPYYFYDCDTHPTPVLVTLKEADALRLPKKVRFCACDSMGVPWPFSKSILYEAHIEIVCDDEALTEQLKEKLAATKWHERLVTAEGQNRERLIEEKDRWVREICGPKLSARRNLMHNELKRLDDLWHEV